MEMTDAPAIEIHIEKTIEHASEREVLAANRRGTGEYQVVEWQRRKCRAECDGDAIGGETAASSSRNHALAGGVCSEGLR